ncbi:MAG: DUF2066 domain-containing protein [Dongiaceae bacterium]
MAHPEPRRPRNALLAPVLALLLALLLPAAAQAQSDLFEVRDVPVDVTAKSAAEARDQAVVQGQRKAWDMLIGRLVSSEDAGRLPTPSDAQLTDMVKSFEVEEEHVSDVRYIGKLAFSFRESPVRDLLGGGQVHYAETVSKPILVVPVLTVDGKSELWEEGNGWRAAWSARSSGGDLVPLLVPLGDAQDLAAIDAGQALAGDTARLLPLAEHYKAPDALVAEAQLLDGGKRLVVTGHRYGTGGNTATYQATATGDGQSLDALFAQGAQRLAEQVQASWKQQNLVTGGAEQTLAVRVPLTGLDNWVEVRRRLSQVATIKRSEVTYLSRQEARLNLVFFGDPAQLAQAVAQRDLSLSQAPDGWVLAGGGAAAAPAPAPSN